MKSLFAVIVFFLPASPLFAELKLPSVFSDHMVLQQKQPIPVWGWAHAGDKVLVQFKGQEKSVNAGGDGRWKVRLDAVDASAEPALFTVRAGDAVITLSDVLVGEVWVCSGQSNMDWSMSRSKDARQEIAAANYPNIRLFKVARKSIPEPQVDCEGSWSRCHSDLAAGFSAVGFFFGRQLHTTLQVPVGLIHTAWGGTPSEGWTRRGAIEVDESMKPLLDRWDQMVQDKKDGVLEKRHQERIAKWKESKAKAEAENKPVPRQPRKQSNPENAPGRPGNLYNGMIAPLIPFAIKGAIWYQGEANQSRAFQYRTLFPMLIKNWRDDWEQGEFPFYYVQIANFLSQNDEPMESSWAEVREAQSMAMDKLEHVGQAVIIDIGMARDIHPKNKQDVGKRLARWALVKDYGHDFVHTGPIFDRMEIKGNKAILSFKEVGSGLMAWDRQQLSGFAVAGEDKKFVWATAKIKGRDTVEVWCDAVPSPLAVRYGWADNPDANLFNREELPACPFRTDDWPGITVNNH